MTDYEKAAVAKLEAEAAFINAAARVVKGWAQIIEAVVPIATEALNKALKELAAKI